MFIKYIFLLLLSYYPPTVNSMYEMEIEILWDTIRGDSDYIYYDHLCSYYRDDDPEELSVVLQNFGHDYSSESQSNPIHRMTKSEFKSATYKGDIHKCSKQAMNTVFEEMTSKHKARKYIILKDMIKYYGRTVPEHQLKQVIETYGKRKIYLTFKLKFPEFRKAVNIGALPKPLHDAVAIEKEMEKLFDEIRANSCDYVNITNMCNYYKSNHDRSELQEVTQNYGYNFHKDEYRVNLDKFKVAGSKGDIPRYSVELMKTAFMEIIPGSESREFYTNQEILDRYTSIVPESQLAYIFNNYGKNRDGQYGLDFHGFRKATNSGYLPDPLSDKIEPIYSLFKEIIPKYKNRNHILFIDMITRFGTENKTILRHVFEKYGKRHFDINAYIDPAKFVPEWHASQYLLYFPDFKRAIGFGDLSEVIEI